MKDSDQEKWIENVFSSMQDIKRAQPRTEVYTTIMQQWDSRDTQIISMAQLRWIAAAAIGVLLLNVFAMRSYTQQQQSDNLGIAIEKHTSQILISSFNMYE